jgi:hypothetical protein
MVSSVQIGEPKGFGWREVLIINAICTIPEAILGISVALVPSSLAGVCLVLAHQPLFAETGIDRLLHGLLAAGTCGVVGIGLCLFFWPVAIGNLYVRRIARRCLDRKPSDQPSYVCQVSLTPRLHGGLRGFMEDADDVGHLWITDGVLNFAGDHVRIAVPLRSVQAVSSRNVGNRGLWVAGRRIGITTSAVDGINSFEFLERQSATVVSSRRISAAIIQELMQKIQQLGGDPTAGTALIN